MIDSKSLIHESVSIANNVKIGAYAVIDKNVSIGEGSCVGALSVVRKSIGSWGIYYGDPLTKLKERKKDLLDQEKLLLKNRVRELPKI